MSSLLSVRNLSLSLAGSIDVLSDISFDIKKNSTVLLSGKNGSGKSMLLRTLKGLIPFQKGSVFLDGEDVTRNSSYRNTHIALVFQ
ncbi:MAG: ATP-binding cassette domain-containing protein, partial [Sphaerochaetaceae bacterium]